MARAFAEVPAPSAGAPRVGLLASAEVIEEGGRWRGGLSFIPEHCAGGGIWTYCGNDADQPKTIEASEAVVRHIPVTIWHGDTCSTAAFDAPDFQARARRALISRQSALIADELWNGAASEAAGHGNAFLNDSGAHTDITPVGGAQPLLQALALMQDTLPDHVSGRAMIHMSRELASVYYAHDAIRREGNLLLDAFDNIIVADEGYDGTGPDGLTPDDGTSWIYGTSLVQVRLDPTVRIIPDPSEPAHAINRDDNLAEWRAERVAAAYWDGCAHLALQVDFCNTCCSTGTGS